MNLNVFIIFWFSVFGSVIGSFLNVVIYRLPLGMSLSHPGSHCPRCKHSIRWYDNLPVIGWVLLGGKCRDCRLPISFRYPLIESVCALFFGATAFYILSERDVSFALEQSLALILFYGTVLTVLLAAGMISFDKKVVPVKLVCFPFLIDMLCFLFGTEIKRHWLGLLLAIPVGIFFALLFSRKSWQNRLSYMLICICVGWYFGIYVLSVSGFGVFFLMVTFAIIRKRFR
ncbi:MAG: prepilin peptidase [Thermoguttaceae bacterium]